MEYFPFALNSQNWFFLYFNKVNENRIESPQLTDFYSSTFLPPQINNYNTRNSNLDN